MSDESRYFATASWHPEEKEGSVTAGALTLAFSSAPALGGRGMVTNPEELLLSALAACFVQTWAIFLAKLKVPIERPELEGSCTLGADPAGGYRVASYELKPHVPKHLLEARGADIERTLQLAEKYCIVSRAVRGEGRTLTVTPEGV